MLINYERISDSRIYHPDCRITEYEKGQKTPWGGGATFGCAAMVFSLHGVSFFACPKEPMPEGSVVAVVLEDGTQFSSLITISSGDSLTNCGTLSGISFREMMNGN